MKILVDPDSVPMSLEECIDNIKHFLDDNDANEIRMYDRNPFDKEKAGAACFLKLAWSLFDEDNRLVKWFDKQYGLSHPDDISGIVMYFLYCDIKEIDRKETETIEEYKIKRSQKKEIKIEEI